MINLNHGVHEMKTLVVSGILAAALLGGCAGRAPAPVAISQAQDNGASCTALRAETAANDEKIHQLGSEKIGKYIQNAVAGFTGAFIWPLWFAMDWQGAQGKEIDALTQRNVYLWQLATERRCPGTSSPEITS
jgi:hypothetical protein